MAIGLPCLRAVSGILVLWLAAQTGCDPCEEWPEPRVEALVEVDTDVEFTSGDYLHLRLLNPVGQAYTGYDRPVSSIAAFPFEYPLGNCDTGGQPPGTYTLLAWINTETYEAMLPREGDAQGETSFDVDCPDGECEQVVVSVRLAHPAALSSP